MKNLEYIISGCGFTRITTKLAHENPDFVNFAKDILARLNNSGHHNVAMLFNAYVESKFGPIFEKYRSAVSSVYSDSGGLQIVTRNLPINDDIMNNIFKTQAKYSDYCVGFDSIPVVKTSDTSSRLDTRNRYFDRSKFDECLQKTIDDSVKQMKILRDTGSNCKALLIIHGNDFDTYVEWYERLYNALAVEFKDHIGGLALASAALGTGPLEDIKRAFYFSQLEKIHHLKHFHVLGVGAITRLTPFLIFLRNGMITPDANISYDSTTHTMGIHFGNYQGRKKKLNFDKTRNSIYDEILEDVNAFEPLGINADKLYEILNPQSYDVDKETLYRTQFLCIMASINNFMNLVNSARTDENVLLDTFDSDRGIYSLLLKARDKKDYFDWEKDVKKYIKSTNVVDYARHTLEDLFV